MYMNLKPNKHKRMSFNKTTMASLGFIDPPPHPQNFRSPLKFSCSPNLIFCSGAPPSPQLFWSDNFRSRPYYRLRMNTDIVAAAWNDLVEVLNHWFDNFVTLDPNIQTDSLIVTVIFKMVLYLRLWEFTW